MHVIERQLYQVFFIYRAVVGHGLTTFSATKFYFSILCLLKSYTPPRPLTTALRHYMAGPLFKSRLRPLFINQYCLMVYNVNNVLCLCYVHVYCSKFAEDQPMIAV